MASQELDLVYATLVMATILNVILMLNMVIALLGDSFDEFQILAQYYDNIEMAKVILEIEQIYSLFLQNKQKKFMHICENFYAEEQDLWQGKVVDMRLLIKNSIDESNRITEKVKEKIEEMGKEIKKQINDNKGHRALKDFNGNFDTSQNLDQAEGRVNESLKKSERRVFDGLAELEGRMTDNLAKREKYMFEGLKTVENRILCEIEEKINGKNRDEKPKDAFLEIKKEIDEKFIVVEGKIQHQLNGINERINEIENNLNSKLDKILEFVSK